MTISELQEQGAIYLGNIQDGFNQYKYEIKKFSGREAYNMILEKWKKNAANRVFVDFYYYCLEPDAKERIDSVLTDVQIQYIKEHTPEKSKEIIFPLDETLLQIIAELNEREMLFSTIYFTGKSDEQSTWWGNYNQEYVIFTK